MIKRINRKTLDSYKINDLVFKKLTEINSPNDDELTCQQWLIDSPEKRHVYHEMYEKIINTKGLRILDIGGGLTSFTREYIARHDYFLIDLMAHDEENLTNIFINREMENSIYIGDWLSYSPSGVYDVIIANDIFPNVDQRLEMFINKYIPFCKEMYISLTFYNDQRFYKTHRVDADEIFHMLSWNGELTYSVIRKYLGDENNIDNESLFNKTDSVFKNGRQVIVIKIKGNYF